MNVRERARTELTPDLFVSEQAAEGLAETIARPSITYWQDAWRRLKANPAAMFGLLVLAVMTIMAIIGPMMLPFEYDYQDIMKIGKPPGGGHWLGTDDLGRDLWVRLWKGARLSLSIGLIAASLDLIIGVIFGGIAGFLGGRFDDIMMRFVEVLYGIPNLLLMIMLSVVLGPGLFTIILVMVVTGWVGMARLVRGQVLQLKEQEYVLAARALGANPWRIILKHLVPNAMGPIIVSVTMSIPGAIFFEAFLSFIGLGVPLPLASWGSLANNGYEFIRLYPWLLIYPASAIAITMLSFNLFGDGLRDALDPRLRR
ncbi:MAG: ABC transporter permease [Bacillota bacterium]